MGDLILIGLPASGKTTVGRQLAQRLDMPFFDCDEAIEAAAGCSVSDIFARRGEAYFRELEHQTLETLCRKEGCVIATGGGAVLHEENYAPLHQNGVIFWLRRDLDKLVRDGRPLSRAGNLNAMYEMREKRYLRFADYIIDNNRALEDTVEDIRKVIL